MEKKCTKNTENHLEKVNSVAQEGYNLAIIATSEQNLLTYSDQIRPRIDKEKVMMKKEEEPER